MDLLRKGVAARQADDGSRDVIAQSGYVAMFLAELGEFAEAEGRRRSRHGSPLTTQDRPFNLANACLADRLVLVSRRATSIGRRRWPSAPSSCARQWGFTRTLGAALSLHGHVLALSGHATQAVDVLEQGVRQAEAFGGMWLRCQRLHVSRGGISPRGSPGRGEADG